MEEPDRGTVERAKGGDRAAFRAIVVAYQHKVHDLLAKMLVGVVGWAEIEDLAQDTFLRIYRALPAFEVGKPGQLTRWVLTIATRLGIDVLRRGRLRQVPLDADDEPAGAGARGRGGGSQGDGDGHRAGGSASP